MLVCIVFVLNTSEGALRHPFYISVTWKSYNVKAALITGHDEHVLPKKHFPIWPK